jgi:TonB family protein
MKACVRAWIGAGVLSLSLAVGGVAAEAEGRPTGDRPLRIIREGQLEVPLKLRMAGITSGEVRLFLSIDARGELTDHLFVAFTHYELANEVSRAMPRWRYEPAMADGRPVDGTVELTVRFKTSGMVISERHGSGDPPKAATPFIFRARELAELDEVPRIVFSVTPPTPAPGISGRVRVDFYIDQTGGVRMPVVETADDERLGWAALAAIAKWQFEIPRRGGYAVLARASQVIVFTADG